jgi:hypothetical protein
VSLHRMPNEDTIIVSGRSAHGIGWHLWPVHLARRAARRQMRQDSWFAVSERYRTWSQVAMHRTTHRIL